MWAFLAVALGGPELYRGRDLGAAHAGLGVTDDAVVVEAPAEAAA
jgi:hemoglobin